MVWHGLLDEPSYSFIHSSIHHHASGAFLALRSPSPSPPSFPPFPSFSTFPTITTTIATTTTTLPPLPFDAPVVEGLRISSFQCHYCFHLHEERGSLGPPSLYWRTEEARRFPGTKPSVGASQPFAVQLLTLIPVSLSEPRTLSARLPSLTTSLFLPLIITSALTPRGNTAVRARHLLSQASLITCSADRAATPPCPFILHITH
jgi:hypothetical protein